MAPFHSHITLFHLKAHCTPSPSRRASSLCAVTSASGLYHAQPLPRLVSITSVASAPGFYHVLLHLWLISIMYCCFRACFQLCTAASMTSFNRTPLIPHRGFFHASLIPHQFLPRNVVSIHRSCQANFAHPLYVALIVNNGDRVALLEVKPQSLGCRSLLSSIIQVSQSCLGVEFEWHRLRRKSILAILPS